MEHRSLSIADQVFEKIENDILTNVYEPGEIVTELKLSENLSVSRTPVREALHRLAQERLVEFIPKGVKIVGINLEDIKIIYEMRLRVEGLAVSLACEKATEEQLNEIKEVLDLQEFYCNKPDSDNVKKMDNKFHELVYKASGSAHLYQILYELHKKTGKYRKTSVSDNNRAKCSVEEHRAIYDAIVKRDKVLAEKLAIEHVKNARDSILEKNRRGLWD